MVWILKVMVYFLGGNKDSIRLNEKYFYKVKVIEVK